MAVKIVCLAADGTGDRKRGAICHIQEGPTLEDIKLGSAVKPPTFFVIGIPDKGIKDLPKEYLEYGGHKSRITVEADKLDATAVTNLAKDDVVELSLASVEGVEKDEGTDWNTAVSP